MPDSDGSDKQFDDNIDALKKYKEVPDSLAEVFNKLLIECNEHVVTEDESKAIQKLSIRYDKKCKRIKEFRREYCNNPKKYGKEIEKRLAVIKEVIKQLEYVRDGIRKRHNNSEEATSNNGLVDDLDNTSVTASTYIESSSKKI